MLELVVAVVVGTLTRGVNIIDISGDRASVFFKDLESALRSRLFKKLTPSSFEEFFSEDEFKFVLLNTLSKL